MKLNKHTYLSLLFCCLFLASITVAIKVTVFRNFKVTTSLSNCKYSKSINETSKANLNNEFINDEIETDQEIDFLNHPLNHSVSNFQKCRIKLSFFVLHPEIPKISIYLITHSLRL
jgi:hypothetical protein